MLEDFGVSAGAVGIWEQLLENPLRHQELYAATPLARGDVDAAVDELLALGIVSVHGPTGRLESLSPVETHRLMLRDEERRWSLRRHALARDVEEFEQRHERFIHSRGGAAEDSVLRLDGSAAVNAHLLSLRSGARASIDSLTPDDGGPIALVEDIDDLVARGVTVRLVVDVVVASRRAFCDQFDFAAPTSPLVRVVPQVPMRMVLIDEVAVTPIDLADPSAGAYSCGGVLGSVAQALFDSLWAAGAPLGNVRSAELTPRERQICHLLVTGATDDQMARSLGLSPRTVRKAIEALARRVCAPSRSALAYQLGAQGLLGPAPGVDLVTGPGAAGSEP